MVDNGLAGLSARVIADVLKNAISKRGDLGSGATGELSDVKDLCSYLRGQRRWVGTAGVSGLLDCDEESVRKWRKDEGLPATFFRGRWKFYLPAVAGWIESQVKTIGPVEVSLQGPRGQPVPN
jgi:hypothetical protein